MADPSRQVVRELVARYSAKIISGELEAGSEMPARREAMHRHETSRQTIDKVFSTLSERGLIDVLPGPRRARVADIRGSHCLEGVRHRRAAFRLHAALDAAARAAGAPVEVLGDVNIVLPSRLVVPDLVVADAHAASEDPATIDVEAVRLVVELAAPGDRTVERKGSRALYAEAAVPHFWCLKTESAPTLTVYELKGDQYVERSVASAGATAHLDAPFPLSVDPLGLVRQ
ncbi:Uma2 family endonuclease [Streptomyces mayonensis]|uniref:Uma2 family endonuclease n=1 Tax=Streptomyces mayonensis TaxID=2750816 RepID=UPI0020A6AB83|nr:Uma2 family endonuclease [Streptomyces sp. A108]